MSEFTIPLSAQFSQPLSLKGHRCFDPTQVFNKEKNCSDFLSLFVSNANPVM